MWPEIIEIPKVSRVIIKDFGIIKRADLQFSPDLNIIIGEKASGKTTIIKYLLNNACPDYKMKSIGEQIIYHIDLFTDERGILIDDLLTYLDKKKFTYALKKLAKCKRQVIVTLRNNLYSLAYIKKIKANIINTKEFQLKSPDTIKNELEYKKKLNGYEN